MVNISRRGFLFGSAALVATAASGALPVVIQRLSEADLIALLEARLNDVRQRMVAVMAEQLFNDSFHPHPEGLASLIQDEMESTEKFEWRTFSMPVA